MKAFISYSHRDEGFLERLVKHMAMLKRESIITSWYDRDILAGSDIDGEVARQLEECEIFLPLVSADFLASNYCYEKEMERAIERHDSGEIRIVPIILHPCEWKRSPLGRFKALPKDGKPISEWENENTAYLDIITELRRVASATPQVEEPANTGVQPKYTPGPRYRVKRDFDQIDRADFRDSAFQSMKEYFKKSIAELDTIDGLRGRFRDLGPASFACTVLNQMKERGEAYITVHARADSGAIGDISYSFSENASPNTANGWMNVGSDDYDLFLQWNSMGFGPDRERMSVQAASELLWNEFISHAGIDYA